MFNIGEKVTCEYFDDDEIFEIIKKRRVIDFADDGETVESDEFRYDIDSDNEFDDDVPESVLHSVKDSNIFIDGKEYELNIGLIVKYCEELDQLISEDGFTIEAYCYDENGKCDFCNEFDIVSTEKTKKKDSEIRIEPISVDVDGQGTIKGIFGYNKECENCKKFKPGFDELTFFIKNE
jgi:hypothetical protein